MNYEIDWDNVWGAVLVIAVLLALIVTIRAITADHIVRYYYLGTDSTRAYCMVADINWALDKDGFCTDDINKALDAMNRANLSLASVQK